MDHLKSLRFQVSLILLVLLFAANGEIYTLQTKQLIKDSAQLRATDSRRLDEIETVAQATSRGYRMLSSRLPTQFITEGGANWFDDGHWTSPQTGAGVINGAYIRANNNFLRRYEPMDWTFIVRIALSFLCIVLAYDTITRERQHGTLHLALANPLPRSAFLLGRFLAHFVVLLISTVVAGLVSLAVLSINGAVHIDAEISAAALLFLVGVALYLSFFLLLTLGVSSLARNSGAALVTMILLWAVLILMIPQSSYLISVHSPDYVGRWQNTAWDSMKQEWQRLRDEGLIMRPRAAAAVDGYATEKQIRRRIDAAEKEQSRNVREAYAKEVRQYRMAWRINLLSPGYAFQYAVESFLGTGIIRYEHLLPQLWQHRQALRDFVRTRDAADPESPHIIYFSQFMSDAEIDSGDIPRFEQRSLGLGESIAAGRTPIIILILEVAASLFFALWAFNRTDLTA